MWGIVQIAACYSSATADEHNVHGYFRIGRRLRLSTSSNNDEKKNDLVLMVGNKVAQTIQPTLSFLARRVVAQMTVGTYQTPMAIRTCSTASTMRMACGSTAIGRGLTIIGISRIASWFGSASYTFP